MMRTTPAIRSGRRRRGIFALGCSLLSFALVATARADDAPVAKAGQAKASARATNRLAKETSPYLLLHAHNPVDWYPWGDEALAKARAEKKLIFLSIGYSSCYWCHVMERESFMDEAIAATLNKNFVCIKVDREERPDIDHIYMTALQTMGRSGGWPLTMILTPEARPIIGGTYFPPRDKEVEVPGSTTRQKMTGLTSFVDLVQDAWRRNPQELRDYADKVAVAVRNGLRQRGAAIAPVNADVASAAVHQLAEQFDPKFGGFSYSEATPRRPKFPEPSNLVLLLDCIRRQNDEPAKKMLAVTLDHMAGGGIRDHLGGGFHRYSTDRNWRVPHFEKMLYDNAQLAGVYAAAWKTTGNAEYRRVADEMLAFVSRELTSPEGGFYSALDAETDGDEGQYYVWTRDEIVARLGPDDARLFGLVYGTTGEPNFEERYVLEIVTPVADVAKAEKLSVDMLQVRLDAMRGDLLAARDKRKRPLTDTKILTAWNGLMIAGLAQAGRHFEHEAYLATAARAADFVLANLRTDKGRLYRSFAQGQGRLNAYLDDYAFLVDGLIELHRATQEERWLAAAEELTKTQIEHFWDAEQGGFYYTSDDHEELLARSKDPVDGALPSGNAVSAGNLVYLGRVTRTPGYLERAEKTINCFAAMMNDTPAAVPRMVVSWAALDEARGE
ncbi:MAG TPA: thioredoxin domain-containing protein [Pirellulales bacterium]|nr:thioredoxin domain-containing protein [Pirellulales bacterium]